MPVPFVSESRILLAWIVDVMSSGLKSNRDEAKSRRADARCFTDNGRDELADRVYGYI